MLTYSNRDLFVFSKRGDFVGKTPVPALAYLQSEGDWVRDTLQKCPSRFDGLALVVNWSTGEMKVVRYAEDN